VKLLPIDKPVPLGNNRNTMTKNTIVIHYTAQLANVAGIREEHIPFEVGEHLSCLLKRTAKEKPTAFSQLLFNEEGMIRRNVIISVDNEQISDVVGCIIKNSIKEIFILTPMSGG